MWSWYMYHVAKCVIVKNDHVKKCKVVYKFLVAVVMILMIWYVDQSIAYVGIATYQRKVLDFSAKV